MFLKQSHVCSNSHSTQRADQGVARLAARTATASSIAYSIPSTTLKQKFMIQTPLPLSLAPFSSRRSSAPAQWARAQKVDAVVPRAGKAIRHTIDAQSSSRVNQRPYICRYRRVSRTRYDHEFSTTHSDQQERCFPSHGDQIPSSFQTKAQFQSIRIPSLPGTVRSFKQFSLSSPQASVVKWHRGRSILEYTYRPTSTSSRRPTLNLSHSWLPAASPSMSSSMFSA